MHICCLLNAFHISYLILDSVIFNTLTRNIINLSTEYELAAISRDTKEQTGCRTSQMEKKLIGILLERQENSGQVVDNEG